MATGAEIINKGVCGSGSLVGYNMSKGCPVPFGEIGELWVTSPSFEYDMTQTFDEDYIKSLQLAGELSIIKNIVSSTEEGADVLIDAAPDGTESIAGDKKYKFKFLWRQDDWLQQKLGNLVGQFNKRVVFVDKSGNISFTSGSTDTKKRGYLASTIYRDRKTYTGSGVAKQQGLNIQFYNAKELDDRTEVMASDLLDFDPTLIEPIVQAYLSYEVTPSNADTTIQFKVVLDRGRKDAVIGLTTSGDFKVLINGVEEAASVAVDAAGVYTITTTALATSDKVITSINGVKEVTGDALYVSNSKEITVV